MKLVLAILAALLGFAATTLAEVKAPARKQRQYNPKEIGVDKSMVEQKKKVKWEGPDFDAAKKERKVKQKTKGKR